MFDARTLSRQKRSKNEKKDPIPQFGISWQKLDYQAEIEAFETKIEEIKLAVDLRKQNLGTTRKLDRFV
jgi:hypothetical protein